MSLISFEAARDVYACCEDFRIEIRSIVHEGARAFSMELRSLLKQLGDSVSEPYWERILTPFQRLRFRATAIPLPFNSPLMVPDGLFDVIQSEVPRSKSISPRFSENLARIAALAEALVTSGDTPLLSVLRELVAGSIHSRSGDPPPIPAGFPLASSVHVVLKGRVDVGLRQSLRQAMGIADLRISGVSGLGSSAISDHLIVIGPLAWYPEHLQTAPRSHLLTSIRYQWLSDGPQPKPALLSTDPKQFSSRIRGVDPPVGLGSSDDSIPYSDIAPSTDWRAAYAAMHDHTSYSEIEEKIPSKLLMLANGFAVYVDARPEKLLDIVVVQGSERRARVPIEDLDAGMFVLLRTAGGGDLIQPMADKLLGKHAAGARERQSRWKEALKRIVAQIGGEAVVRELKALGCQRANRQNLHNWMSDQSIRPEYDDDFLSILVLCKLDSEDRAFVENADRIDRAHRSAGFVIRKQLLKRVEEANLSQMTSAGFVEFQLTEAVGGSFTAYRIEDISPDNYSIPFSQVGHPYSIGARAWQG